MRTLRIPLVSAVAALCFTGIGAVQAAAAPADEPAAFRRLTADYLRDYFAAHPVRATQLGIHDHDGQLPDFSTRALRRRSQILQQDLARLLDIDRSRLERDDVFDHRILEHALRAELLELEEVREWARNPMLYNRLLAAGVASLIDREFGTLELRLRSLIERLDQFPRLIGSCRKNMKDVPAIWANLALQSTRGTLTFLRDSVPVALRAQGLYELDPDLRKRWERAYRRAIERVEDFALWLEQDLRPRAHGDFRLGRELFERKLLYEEHISLSVDKLAAMNEAAIERYQDWVTRESRRIDPDRSREEVMQEIAEEFPTRDELISTARQLMERARDFIIEHDLVTLPTDRLPEVRPTPEYARMGFASMSTPGPFETQATESYYNVTNVSPDWTPEQQAQHLTYFNYPALLGISIHEAMPGHFVQLLYQREAPSDLRKIFAPSSLLEGWAHYTEQMMVDEGLGDGEPTVRLAQLRRALQRHARWYAGIALHAWGVTVEEAASRFADIAYFAPFPALRETRRGTYDPTYLYYALGRMQILELREDYRSYLEDRGEEFSLRDFHDRFLALGLPIGLAREALMPSDPAGVASDAAD